MIDLVTAALAILSGAAIGLILGLVGGGGSILAVPLLVHVVGIRSPHMAIGTAAIAVGLNAAMGLVGHARHGMVKWRCGLLFAAAGVAGALTGAELGKAYDGQKLLFLFGGLMVVVGLSMLRKRTSAPRPDVVREFLPDLARQPQHAGRPRFASGHGRQRHGHPGVPVQTAASLRAGRPTNQYTSPADTTRPAA